MAGYFDKNKDYSLAIKQAQQSGASQSTINQLRQERQNKIDSNYGGKDPYRGSSNIMGNRGSGSSRSDRDATNDALRRGEHVGGVFLDPSKRPGGSNYQGGGWTQQEQYEGVTDSTRPSNLGRYNYGGAYDPSKHDSIIDRMTQEAAKGDAADWDAIGGWSAGLITGSGNGYDTTGDGTLMNQVMEDLQRKYHYDANRYYGSKYDKIYGAGAWADPDFWGKPGQSVNPDYANAAGQSGSHGNPGGGLGSFGGFGSSGGPGRPGGFGSGPASDYIRDMFQQRENAVLEALKAEYNASMSKLQGVGADLGDIYGDERNRVAAQADIEKMNLNNMGIAQGLNTGATGQLALGQSNAYLGALGQLGRQESQNRADNERDIAALTQAYESKVAAAKAQIKAELNDALLNDWRRAEDLAADERRQAEADRRWQQQWEAEQAETRRKADLQRAEIMAGLGDMSGYEALGIFAQNQQAQEQAQQNATVPGPVRNDDLRPVQNRKNGGMTADKAGAKYGQGGLGAEALDLKRDLLNIPGLTQTNRAAMIRSAVKSGRINEGEAEELLSLIGY